MRRLACALALFAACSNNNSQNNPTDDLAVADLTGGGGDGGADAAIMCTAGAFLGCEGANANFCNAGGDGVMSVNCGAACMGSTDMGTPGCGQCSADSCSGGTLTACDTTTHKTASPAPCVTLQVGGTTTQICQ